MIDPSEIIYMKYENGVGEGYVYCMHFQSGLCGSIHHFGHDVKDNHITARRRAREDLLRLIRDSYPGKYGSIKIRTDGQ